MAKPKLCNYCKNHSKPNDPPVLEKHHRPCEKYNNEKHFKECKACRQNHRKTENVRKWRANKNLKLNPDKAEIERIYTELMKEDEIYECVTNQKIDLNDADSEQIIEMTQDDYIIEYTDSMITESSKSTESLNLVNKDIGNTFVIMHPFSPNSTLNSEDVIRFQSQIEGLIDDMSESDKTPKFKSNTIESGCWRVACADEFTRNWFEEKASAFTCLVNDSYHAVRIIPLQELQTFICTAYIPGRVLENSKILKRFHKQNQGLDTSRWHIIECTQLQNQFFISFAVDPVSYEKIQTNNSVLNFGMSQVKFAFCKEVEEIVESEEIEEVCVI